MSPIRTPGLPGRPASVAHLGRTLCVTRTQDWQRNTMGRPGPVGRSDGAGRRARAGAYHRCPAGSAPRHPGVPSANEDRLVVPDILGTTIKLSFLEGPARLAPADYSQRGRCCPPYIGSAYVVTCPEIRWPPGFWFSEPAPSRHSQPRAGRPATECERGRDLSALAGTPCRIFACADCIDCPVVCAQIRLLWRASGRWADRQIQPRLAACAEGEATDLA